MCFLDLVYLYYLISNFFGHILCFRTQIFQLKTFLQILNLIGHFNFHYITKIFILYFCSIKYYKTIIVEYSKLFKTYCIYHYMFCLSWQRLVLSAGSSSIALAPLSNTEHFMCCV